MKASGGEERRARRAARNRAHIIEAGQQLLKERGYFTVTVEEIADAADVSPATVYSTVGGKTGILHALMDDWANAPELTSAAAELPSCDTVEAVLRLIAAASKAVRQAHGDVMQIMLATAPHDQAIADELAVATRRYQTALRTAAEHLVTIGAIPAVNVDSVGDALWFYFGYAGWFTLIRDLQWTMEHAEEWLLSRAWSYVMQASEIEPVSPVPGCPGPPRA